MDRSQPRNGSGNSAPPPASPVKSFSASTSPRVTPTKGPNPYGDRFIPLRQPMHEWNARFCALNSPERDNATIFKKPMGNSNRNNVQSTEQATNSGTATPSGYVIQQACCDVQKRDDMVVRALLRNELLKARIDDIKVKPLTADDNVAHTSQIPIVATYPHETNPHYTMEQPSSLVHGNDNLVIPMDTSPSPAVVPTPQPNTSTSTISTAAAAVISTSPGGAAVSTVTRSQLEMGGTPHRSTTTTTTTASSSATPNAGTNDVTKITSNYTSSPNRNFFTYSAKTTPSKYGPPSTSLSNSPFSGPLGDDSQRLLKTPRKPQRKVPKNPYKVLDAPELQDDFYLNLVDWSAQNQLSVGLNTCVYLWSASNSQVTKLCDLGPEQDTVTSVQWADKGDLLAVGTNRGVTQIWDASTLKKIRDLNGHTSRVGCLAWNADTICSGSRDRTIIHRDIRCDSNTTCRKYTNHRQEVCGLKWSPDKQLLASGGNDNQLLIWNLRRDEPVQTYRQHNAAVKALAWSPHQHGLLVSGGGTADRCLKFWNTLTGQPMQSIDTGSQVCNVAWSKHSSELVSTHGYSYNHVIIWKYPSLQPVAKLVGHQYRVLYLAMSPDGESIVTGAGDETLRFWHVFNKTGAPRMARSKLNLFSSLR